MESPSGIRTAPFYRAFQAVPEGEFKAVLDRLEATEIGFDTGRRLLCRACSHPVTSTAQRITVNGGHTHVFHNPAGVEYEIGCFRQAPGCVKYAEATVEHTWFPGYVWCFALCVHCHEHLGWHYQGESGFYGLILKQLVEEQ